MPSGNSGKSRTSSTAIPVYVRRDKVPRRVTRLYVQRDQPPGVPPLELTGERTLPDVPEENYWFRRHLVVYEWIAERVNDRRLVDLACGEGYGSALLARHARSVIGVDANPEAFEHARLKYAAPNLGFERNMIELWQGDVDCVVFLQTIEHVQDPDAMLVHVRELIGPGGVAFVTTPERAHARAEGRRALGQPVARPRVPPRGVPSAVRGALRHGRAARPLPRPPAAGPRDRAAARLGSRARRAAHHAPVLRPLHPRDLDPRLRAEDAAPWSARSTSWPCCGHEPRRAGDRPAHPHALRRGLRDVAVRRGVAVGGDRDLATCRCSTCWTRRPGASRSR